MPSLTTAHPLALRILMTDDIYSLEETAIVEVKAIEEIIVVEPTVVAEPTIIPEKEKPDAPETYNYLGENNKYLLIMVEDAKHEFISPKNLETLNNILKGKQLEIKDIALVNIAKHPAADYKSLKNYFACSKIALFGIDLARLGLREIASNQIVLHEGVKVLASYSIDEMNDDIAKKRTFWNEMKNL